MKKRPFILIELLIAIAILSVCAIPIMGYPFYAYSKQKTRLLEIEFQRLAEVLFFDLLANSNKNWSWNKIQTSHKPSTPSKIISLPIEGFGVVPIYSHYHLHLNGNAMNTKNKHHVAKLWCTFCFNITDTCSIKAKDKDDTIYKNPYSFQFFTQQIEEKP